MAVLVLSDNFTILSAVSRAGLFFKKSDPIKSTRRRTFSEHLTTGNFGAPEQSYMWFSENHPYKKPNPGAIFWT
jgi:hypothetical protein